MSLYGGQYYTGGQTQSAALKATETSIKQQQLLDAELKKEQEDHDKLHAAMMQAEKELLTYAKQKKIDMRPSSFEKGLFSEKSKPATLVLRAGNDITPEFGRRLSEYEQKFASHEGSNKRLKILEEQIINERKQSKKVLKTARGITEKEAEAAKRKAKADESSRRSRPRRPRSNSRN